MKLLFEYPLPCFVWRISSGTEIYVYNYNFRCILKTWLISWLRGCWTYYTLVCMLHSSKQCQQTRSFRWISDFIMSSCKHRSAYLKQTAVIRKRVSKKIFLAIDFSGYAWQNPLDNKICLIDSQKSSQKGRALISLNVVTQNWSTHS